MHRCKDVNSTNKRVPLSHSFRVDERNSNEDMDVTGPIKVAEHLWRLADTCGSSFLLRELSPVVSRVVPRWRFHREIEHREIEQSASAES